MRALLAAGLLAVALPVLPAHAAGPCPTGATYRVGAAKADITPTTWPVGEAAYSIGRMATRAAHPFYARAVAISSCSTGATIVLEAVDSQGYFAAYKEDVSGQPSFGTDGVRTLTSAATGVPAANITVSATHTHNSPDSVGVWGGGSVENNKAPYLTVLRAGAVKAAVAAVRAMQPARLLLGTSDISSLQATVAQVSADPADYPVDTQLRVLQVVGTDCRPITTFVNASVHATVAGEIPSTIDPDWPGRVATLLDRQLPGETAVVLPAAVGRTQPRFPRGLAPRSKDPLVGISAYGDILTRRVDTALASARPVAAGPVAAVQTEQQEEVQDPALLALFLDEQGVPNPTTGKPALGGLMRSVLPPYTTGNLVRSQSQTFRVGPLLLAGTPGEAYPQVATELRSRVRSPGVFVLGMANDQIGYTPPAYEYPLVALVDGGDEGVFTINPHLGSDLINGHLAAARALGFTTTGSEPYLGTGTVVPPDQFSPAPEVALHEPAERPLPSSFCVSAASRPVPLATRQRARAARPADASPRARLASTGLPSGLPAVAVLLAAGSVAVRRRAARS